MSQEVLRTWMKSIRLVTVATLAAALAGAQMPRAGGGGTPPDPATLVQMRVNMLATLLSLTDAQKTQATTIFTNAETAAQAVMSSLQTSQESLAAAVKANNTAAIDQAAGTIGTLQGQLTAIHAKGDAAFYAILTADQQAKYDALPHGGPIGRGPGMGGHFRGGPPPQ
jgi:Spy/CpxP family protein refolding chaperone